MKQRCKELLHLCFLLNTINRLCIREELQTYIDGSVLYVPKASAKKEWRATSGARTFYQERNKEIQKLFKEGYSIEALTEQYGLAYSTIKK